MLFAGSLFFVCFFVFLVAGDTIGDALMTAGAAAGIGLAGAAMFAVLGARDERQRQKFLAAIRTRLEQRGTVSDEAACESIPIESRPLFLKVRAAVADYLGCPPEWLRASDSLPDDYQSLTLGWGDLELHVFERLLESGGFIDPDRIRDNPVEGTLADLTEHVRTILDEEGLLEPPQAESPAEPAS